MYICMYVFIICIYSNTSYLVLSKSWFYQKLHQIVRVTQRTAIKLSTGCWCVSLPAFIAHAVRLRVRQ